MHYISSSHHSAHFYFKTHPESVNYGIAPQRRRLSPRVPATNRKQRQSSKNMDMFSFQGCRF
eukprot:2353461-Amphidinium_carterae.1